MKKIWSYLFTTADSSIQEGMVGDSPKTDHGIDAPLAGLGYGLPISRSYCRYFGGDLSIMSMEVGTCSVLVERWSHKANVLLTLGLWDGCFCVPNTVGEQQRTTAHVKIPSICKGHLPVETKNK